MSRKQADLIFDKGTISGFATLAEQSDLNPVTVVRELVQNSLDAAQEAKNKKAIIRFEIAKHKPADIPAFETYKAKFNKAKKGFEDLGNIPDSAQSVINAIKRQINKTKIETLFVTDNGIGLNESRMNALLAEALSNKPREGAGSFGYGHTTFIPTSDLRYMLYGGLCEGKKIAAGHAVLASFKDTGEIKGKDGYFVVRKREDMKKPFVYPDNKSIPKIIKDKLDIIEGEWGTGSVVIMPGFNRFNEANDEIDPSISLAVFPIWEDIKKAVACNFFVAIQEGKLQVEYKEGDETQILDKKAIVSVLEEHQEEKRTHFLSGYKAKRAHTTMVEGIDFKVPTSLGEIKIRVMETVNEGQSQIDLCRNGMHITSSVPFLKNRDFADYAPFNCLILVKTSNRDFHRLVRKSEPPKHDKIDRKRLELADKDRLDYCLKEIRDFLKENLNKLESEEFKIRDVLNLKSFGVDALEELPPRVRAGGLGSGGSGGGGSGRRGAGGGGDGSGGSGFKRAGRAVSFRATPVQTGKRSYSVQVALEQSQHDNEIRFALDESLDLTCDSVNSEEFVFLKNIKIDGNRIPNEKLIKNEDGKILGINIGSGEDEQVNMTFDFELSKDSGIDKDVVVSLQAEVVRRQVEKVG
jgi:uncharacterized membrane protein YgcG